MEMGRVHAITASPSGFATCRLGSAAFRGIEQHISQCMSMCHCWDDCVQTPRRDEVRDGTDQLQVTGSCDFQYPLLHVSSPVLQVKYQVTQGDIYPGCKSCVLGSGLEFWSLSRVSWGHSPQNMVYGVADILQPACIHVQAAAVP